MKDQSLGEFQELILLLVASLHNEAYGVAIMKRLQEETGRKYNISAVHMALKRLEGKGFVESSFGGIKQERGGRRKKYYTITAQRKAALDRQYQLRTRIYQQIPKINFN